MFIFQSSALSHAQTFIDVLARTAEHQLLQYDNLLVIDDVIKGRKWNLQILTVIILWYPHTVQLYYYILHLWNFPLIQVLNPPSTLQVNWSEERMLDFHWRMMKIKGLFQGAKILGQVRKFLQCIIGLQKYLQNFKCKIKGNSFIQSIHTFLVKCYIFVVFKITIKSEVYMYHNLYMMEWLPVGTSNNELVIGEPPSKVNLTASVTTAKTTLGQSATITARESAYQVQCGTQSIPSSSLLNDYISFMNSGKSLKWLHAILIVILVIYWINIQVLLLKLLPVSN